MTERMSPYLIMDGRAREAVGFYQQAFDATVVGMQTFGEMPSDPNHPVPDTAKDLILHALLKIGDMEIMLSDTFPGTPFQPGNHINIAFVTDNIDRARKVFDALAEGGHISMPFQQTFWSPGFGQLTDRFGVIWQISTETGR